MVAPMRYRVIFKSVNAVKGRITAGGGTLASLATTAVGGATSIFEIAREVEAKEVVVCC